MQLTSNSVPTLTLLHNIFSTFWWTYAVHAQDDHVWRLFFLSSLWFSKGKTVRVGWTKSDQLILFAYRRCNYEYKWGTTLSATSLQKKKKMRGGKVISATLILVFSFLYTPFSSLPVQSFHFHLLYLQSDSLPPNSVDKVGPAYSGSSVPSLCLVPPWVYALLDCAMCARVDTWNCKRTWREREKSATIRKRHEMKLSSHKPISSYILRQLDSFFWLRYISFWFLKVV